MNTIWENFSHSSTIEDMVFWFGIHFLCFVYVALLPFQVTCVAEEVSNIFNVLAVLLIVLNSLENSPHFSTLMFFLLCLGEHTLSFGAVS